MKKVINCAIYILLRLVPMLYLLFFLFSLVRDVHQEFNRLDNFNFRLYLDSFAFVLCFVFLGIASILRILKATVKLSDICKYFASVMALIYVFLYISARIQSVGFRHTPGLTIKFFGLILEIQQTLYIISFLIITISCFIKDKFFKTKWILTTLCSLSFLLASFHAPLYTLTNYSYLMDLRLWFNTFLYSYGYCAVIITGLSPSTIKVK